MALSEDLQKAQDDMDQKDADDEQEIGWKMLNV